MMKKMLTSLIVTTTVLSCLFGQVEVVPGTGNLSAALAEATDGDVFLLVPGGEYIETDSSKIGKFTGMNITIKVDGDGTERAVVRHQTPFVEGSVTPEFFILGDSASLTLNGIEFDGLLNNVANVKNFINFNVGDPAEETFIKKIDIENCYVHDLMGSGEVIVSGSSDHWGNLLIDTTLVNNSIFDQTGTVIYYKKCGANYISFTNSTCSNIKSYGFRIAGPIESGMYDNTPKVDIDRTTWYNIGTEDGREILQLEKGPNLNPWMVTNSIFVKQVDKSRTVINLKDNPSSGVSADDTLSTVTNICVWDVGNINYRGHTVSDTITMDPGFINPDSGDFTLPSGSELLTFATDGGAIGDPRWAPAVVSVDNNQGQILEKYSLHQNYPNPFNPTTSISFTLERSGLTTLAVYDVLGQKVVTLTNEKLNAGDYSYTFDASEMTSGVYFYQLQSSGIIQTRKMMLIK